MPADPRLFLEDPLLQDAEIALEKDQAHYLLNVMRRRAGDAVRLFNGRDGEWRAEITEAGKRAATLNVIVQTRPQYDPPDLWLLFAPVKKARTDFIAEKATELGVTRIQPVFTRFTNTERVRTDRLAALAREAAEQTERLDLPEVTEALTLQAALHGWDAARPLIYCDEAGDDAAAPWGGEAGRAPPALEALEALARYGESSPGEEEVGAQRSKEVVSASPTSDGSAQASAHPTPALSSRGGSEKGANFRTPEKLAVLIGPEGGFSPEERESLHGLPHVVPISLGPRILRADSAAVAALTLVQSVWGDWRR